MIRAQKRSEAWVGRVGVCAILTLLPAVAHAQPSSGATETSESDAVYQRGRALYDAKDYLGAIGVWERLLSTIGEQRGWKLLYSLGLAHQAVGDVTLAIERLEAFVKLSATLPEPRPAALEQRRHDAEERVQALKKSHGAVFVRPPSSGEALLVRVGTSDARPAGFTVYLSPGPHEIEIASGTARARRIVVDVTAGGRFEVDAEQATRPPEATPVPPAQPAVAKDDAAQPRPPLTEPSKAEPPAARFPTAWLLAGAGVTAASFALPIALGLRAQSKNDAAMSLGAGDTGYAGAVHDYESARTLYYVSYALPAAFAVATGLVVILKATGRGGDIAVTGSAAAGGVGLCAFGTF